MPTNSYQLHSRSRCDSDIVKLSLMLSCVTVAYVWTVQVRSWAFTVVSVQVCGFNVAVHGCDDERQTVVSFHSGCVYTSDQNTDCMAGA